METNPVARPASTCSRRNPRPDEAINPSCHVAGVLMLPHPDHDPARALQGDDRDGIAVPRSFELRNPPLGVCLRDPTMVRTEMSETPVYENRDPGAPKHHVCPSRHVLEWTNVHTVPEAQAVEFPTQREFGGCVPATYVAHTVTDLSRRSRRRPASWRCRWSRRRIDQGKNLHSRMTQPHAYRGCRRGARRPLPSATEADRSSGTGSVRVTLGYDDALQSAMVSGVGRS